MFCRLCSRMPPCKPARSFPPPGRHPQGAHLDDVHPQAAAPLHAALLQEQDEAVRRPARRRGSRGVPLWGLVQSQTAACGRLALWCMQLGHSHLPSAVPPHSRALRLDHGHDVVGRGVRLALARLQGGGMRQGGRGEQARGVTVHLAAGKQHTRRSTGSHRGQVSGSLRSALPTPQPHTP